MISPETEDGTIESFTSTNSVTLPVAMYTVTEDFISVCCGTDLTFQCYRRETQTAEAGSHDVTVCFGMDVDIQVRMCAA